MMSGPIIFGEVLFDCFADRPILGGAPFNVAWNLCGFGQAPLFIGAVGQDELGQQVRSMMDTWGLETQGLQRCASHPTGQVLVSLNDGEPSYDILADQAYDHIAAAPAIEVSKQRRRAILYHGTLALRHQDSKATLDALHADTARPIFLDVNLRSPWWDAESLPTLLKRATWVKLNAQELTWLTPEHLPDMPTKALWMQDRYGLDAVILTLGAEGALVVSKEGHCIHRPATPAPSAVCDTVGAGDAFSSVVLIALMQEWSWEKTIAHAAQFAAKVCTLHGATTSQRAFYTETAEQWA